MGCLNQHKSSEPWLFKLRSSEGFIIFVISIAMLTDMLLYTLIIPILPKILVSRAGVPEEDAQFWISILLAAYGATLLLGSLLFGYFSDQFGSRRAPFTLGLGALCASTLLFAIARTPLMLVLARAFQGLSCAAVGVIGLVLIVDNVAQERIGEAMGYTTIGMTAGGLLGPVIGGVGYDFIGYYGVFVLPTVLIIFDIILRLAMIERRAINQPLGDEPAEDTEHDTHGTSPDLDPAFRSQQDEIARLIPTRSRGVNNGKKAGVLLLLRSPRLLVSLLSALMLSLILTSMETTVPLYVMEIFHWTPSAVGLIFLASAISDLSGSLIGRLVDRFGGRRPAFLAFVLAGAAFFSLRFIQHNNTFEKVLLGILFALIGLGVMTVQIVAMTEISQVVYDYEAQSPGIFGDKAPLAQGYALFNMAYASGQFLGPIIAGSLRVRAGWAGITLFFGILGVVCAIPVGIWSGSSSSESQSDDDGVHAQV
ncbi:uncharacterized protein GIQ15_04692 [Arthroderma uncinatum]|uniref:uncharacterized protein n=1 Tax=Arthroderma uncinatum TaxID=74035 RepID=UPI00144AAB57|nr:uncharacterized protein GIQ15_04692 [Arthroderma uncinatum]KAF3481933.1 hypothetical protein GIQ15_04692 [Arthroderma uncinatum]